MWTLTTTLALSSHISTFDRGVSHIVAAPLITAIRIFYSASLSWMIVASQTGHGGLFAKIMNAPVFVHLNKLSYAIYLLNPVLITVIYGYRDHSSHVDPLTLVRLIFLRTKRIEQMIYYLSCFFFRRFVYAVCYDNWHNGSCLRCCRIILAHVRDPIHKSVCENTETISTASSANSYFIDWTEESTLIINYTITVNLSKLVDSLNIIIYYL